MVLDGIDELMDCIPHEQMPDAASEEEDAAQPQ